MTGISDDNVRPVLHDGEAANPGDAHVTNGIRSLHNRIDDLERLVEQRLETEGKQSAQWLHEHCDVPHQLPAWKRRTNGETRWPVAVVTAIAIGLQVAVPDRLVLVRPAGLLPAVQALLLVALVLASPHRMNNESRILRMLALILAALLSLANGWSVARLAVGIVDGSFHNTTAGHILITGVTVWLTNVIAFALWYWEFDRGGAVARALATKPYPDFLFPQMTSPELAPPHWEPTFADYLYLAFTNASAFSPTDVLPLSRWAKMLMTVQSVVSIVTVALVVARAVNILP